MAVVLAALLLSMRKQRVQTAHQIVQMRRSIERSRRGLWDLQLEVSRQLEPKTLRRAIEEVRLSLEPILASSGPERSDLLLAVDSDYSLRGYGLTDPSPFRP